MKRVYVFQGYVGILLVRYGIYLIYFITPTSQPADSENIILKKKPIIQIIP